MPILRTPDERFAAIPDYPYTPRYAEVGAQGVTDGTLRMAYVDEGPADADPVLLLHGEPSWGFLYRHMIPVLVAAGHRVVVPDLIGFGRSDKPSEKSDYSYARQVAWTTELVVEHLDLQRCTFFGQDWGGLIGLRVVAAHPDRFARVVIGNTGLPTGEIPPNEAFLAWRSFSRDSPKFPIGQIVNGGCTTDLSPDVIAAYDAPYPDDSYKAGARIFPSLVPASPDDPEHDAQMAAWTSIGQFHKPWLCAFSDSDPVTKGGAKAFLRSVPGCEGLSHPVIEGAGHFLQEDRGPEVARVIVDFIAAHPA
ncbi:MAG: hypothetical protein RLZ04_520 [Actinomycetota bacterium]|jgi:haloalkane dehalogenase